MLTRIVLLVLALGLIPARAELWQSSRWAMLGEFEAGAGYDSNLTLSEDGAASAFLSAQPALRLRRHGSSTKLDLRLAAETTHFFHEGNRQTDGFASIEYAFPQVDTSLPRFTGSAHWMRVTAGHASLGRRITAMVADASFSARLFSTGKLGVHSHVEFNRHDFNEDDLHTNQRAGLRLGAAYAPNPNKEFSLNLLAATGESEPNRSGLARVRSRELGLTLGGRGNLAAKISGALHAGFATVRYRGVFRRSDVLPLAGGEVTWNATVRSKVVLALDVGADFSPLGESLAVQRLTLGLDQTIRGPWRWRARVVPAMTGYYRELRVRRDRSWGGGLTLVYDPSERFDASLSHDFTSQRSDQPFATFERSLTTANVSYRF